MNSSLLLFVTSLLAVSVWGQSSLYSVIEQNKYSNTSSLVIEKIKATSVAECNVQCRRRAWCCSTVYSQSTGKCGFLISEVPTKSAPIGWEGVSSGGLTVVRPDHSADQPSDCCAEMPLKAIKYGYWGPLNILTPDNGPITNITTTLTKTFDYTDLRVTFSSDLRCLSGCCRFYLTYNGVECSNPAPNDLIMHHVDSARGIFWTGYMEGICRGIPSGTVNVRLNTGQCGTLSAGDMTIGIRAGIRLMVEEMELSKTNLPSACLSRPNFNIQQYAINSTSDADSGVIYSLNYHKRASETALKLTFVGTTRSKGSCTPTSMCAKWEFLINGVACANPLPLEGRIYQYGMCGTDHQYTSPVSGVCSGVAAGDLQISISLSACPGYTTAISDSYTGYGAMSHIIAEEVRIGTPYISPRATPVFNVQTLIQSIGGSTGLLQSLAYVKARNDTTLRVSWSSGLRQYVNNVAQIFCNRWYITFNSQNCVSPGTIDSTFLIDGAYVSSSMEYYRMTKFFGLCRGITAGTITVGVNGALCTGYTYGNPAVWSTSTLTVEEVFEQF